jgi:hypothetical protein
MTAADAAGTIGVHLRGVPAATLHFAQDQHDALLRELALMTMGVELDDVDGAELVALRSDLVDLREVFATFRPMVTTQVGERDGNSSEVYDLTLELPAGLAARADQGNELFDRLEARCGQGLVLLARPPVLASGFRRWFLLEVANQLRSGPATAWPQWWEAHGDGSAPVPETEPAPLGSWER